MNVAKSRALLPTAAAGGLQWFMVMGEGVKRHLGGKLDCWDALVWTVLWEEGGHSHIFFPATSNCFGAEKEML